MSNKEKLKQLRLQLEELIKERNEIMTPGGDNIITITIESASKLEAIKEKMDDSRKLISELTQIISNEERSVARYTVFGKYTDENGIIAMDSRAIPHDLKEKFLNEFDIANSLDFPTIFDIDKFLEDNRIPSDENVL